MSCKVSYYGTFLVDDLNGGRVKGAMGTYDVKDEEFFEQKGQNFAHIAGVIPVNNLMQSVMEDYDGSLHDLMVEHLEETFDYWSEGNISRMLTKKDIEENYPECRLESPGFRPIEIHPTIEELYFFKQWVESQDGMEIDTDVEVNRDLPSGLCVETYQTKGSDCWHVSLNFG